MPGTPGNPYHGKDGKFTSGPAESSSTGNRAIANHIKGQHKGAVKRKRASWPMAKDQRDFSKPRPFPPVPGYNRRGK